MKSVIILQGGKGKKAEYNGLKARVLRRKGGWATVTPLLDGDDSSSLTDCPPPTKKLKWRSQAWKAQHGAIKDDGLSLVDLPDAVLSHLLSFFVHATDAIGAASSLSKTCRNLRHRIKDAIAPITGGIKANLRHLDYKKQLYTLIGLSIYRFKLEELKVDVGTTELMILARVMEQFLNCKELKSFVVRTKLSAPRFALFNDSHSWPDGRSNFRVVCDHDTDPDKLSPLQKLALQMKREENLLTYCTEEFNYFLSHHCPQLKAVTTLVHAPSCRDRDGNHALFSMPGLRQVHIQFIFLGNYRLRGAWRIISEMHRIISSIPKLENLELSSMHPRASWEWMKNLELSSRTVKTIDVTGMGKGFFFTQCTCPKLERFTCAGGYYGNGVRPMDAEGDFILGYPFHVGDGWIDRGDGFSVQVGEARFSGMHAPDSCVIDFDRNY